MAKYYVNGSGSTYDSPQGTYGVGNDSTGNGSLSAPYASWTKAMASVSTGNDIYGAPCTYIENEAALHCMRVVNPYNFIADGGAVVIKANAVGSRVVYVSTTTGVTFSGVGGGNFEFNDNGTQEYIFDSGNSVNDLILTDCKFVGTRNDTAAAINQGATSNGWLIVNPTISIVKGRILYGPLSKITIQGGTTTVANFGSTIVPTANGCNVTLTGHTINSNITGSSSLIYSRPGTWVINGGTVININGHHNTVFTASPDVGTGSLTFQDSFVGGSGILDYGAILISSGTWDVEIFNNDFKLVNTAINLMTWVKLINQISPSIHGNTWETVTTNRTEGIYISSTGVSCGVPHIDGDTFLTRSINGHMIQIGEEASGTSNNKLDGAIVENCTIYGPYHFDPLAPSTLLHSIFFGMQINCTARKNRVIGTGYGVIFKSNGMSFTDPSTGATQNICENVGGPGQAVLYSKGTKNVPFYHNLLIINDDMVNYPSSMISLAINAAGETATGCLVKNNIVINYGTPVLLIDADPTSYTGLDASNNLYYQPLGLRWKANGVTYNTLATWQAAGYDNDSLDAEPHLYPDYHLQSASPCIGAGISIPAIHEQATLATDLDDKTIHFLPPSIGPYDGQGDTKTITSNYSPTGYGIREGATVALGAHGLSVSFAGLTLNENNIRVKEAGTYRAYSFTRKAGTTQYVYGSNSGGSGGGIFGGNFG